MYAGVYGSLKKKYIYIYRDDKRCTLKMTVLNISHIRFNIHCTCTSEIFHYYTVKLSLNKDTVKTVSSSGTF